MSYSLIPTPTFKKELKRLKKKVSFNICGFGETSNELLANPRIGNELFKNCYKIRFAIKSKGKGKSGGGRLITFVKIEGRKIYLLTIYDKSDLESVSISYLRSILSGLKLL